MGNILATCFSWCFCTAITSLCTSCCGNDKASSIPPGVTSGRKRSILLLLLAIGISFLYQYTLAPNVIKYSNEFGPLGYMGRSWNDGCEQYNTNQELQIACAGRSGVYRSAATAFTFFILAAMGAYCKPTANREAWVAKYFLFILVTAGTIFIPNEPLFTPIFVNIFRVGAILYMIFNQLIILDLCFNVNDSLVAKANQADIEEEHGAGKKWLIILLVLSASFYIICFVCIGLMYAYFRGCSSNVIFITITIVMGLLCTFIQLSGEEASLFTSASIFAYATYLLYTAVSKNPDGTCNPVLGENDVFGIILGVGLTLIGALWTGYSSTAYKSVGDESDEKHVEVDEEKEESRNENVQGIALGEESKADKSDTQIPVTFSTSWKINIILAALCCWFAMVLTSWGSIMSGGSVANPQSGRVGMWMVICSQWLIYILYLWTLVAPKLFPDRDFS